MVAGLIKATTVEGIKSSNTISTPPSSTINRRREETQAIRNLNTIRINTSSTGAVVVAVAAIHLGEVSTKGRATRPKARRRLGTREPSLNHSWWKVRTVRVSSSRAPSSLPPSPYTRIRNTQDLSKNTMSSLGLATSP
jgi:hypothetical protein